jgi:hypothetical protein
MSEPRHASLGIHGVDADDPAHLLKRGQIMRRARIATIAVLVLLAIGAGRTVISRMSNARSLETGTAERAKQYVKTAQPKASFLTMPCSTVAPLRKK